MSQKQKECHFHGVIIDPLVTWFHGDADVPWGLFHEEFLSYLKS